MFCNFRCVPLLLGQGQHMVSTPELYREKTPEELPGAQLGLQASFPSNLSSLVRILFNENCFPFPQLVFSFNDKLFGLLVKDMEAMDPSILKGESGTSKKQKVGSQELLSLPWALQSCRS